MQATGSLERSAGRGRREADLVRRWQRPLLDHARRFLGNETDAADAVQDIFIRLLREFGPFQDQPRSLSPADHVLLRQRLQALQIRSERRFHSLLSQSQRSRARRRVPTRFSFGFVGNTSITMNNMGGI